MIHEYIITAFKVIVGIITEERLMLFALIALGVLFIWMFLSLLFSFQGKFVGKAKRINEYLNINGIKGEAKSEFEALIAKMPTEFQRGYKKFERSKNGLPSEHIKRFESLDMELSGGVFNQNKSVLKTFIHFVFVGLLVFSLAVLPIDEALTGYALAEAAVIPLIFFVVAKVLYYIYTAIRQYQYKAAIEEFNLMLENLDRLVADSNAEQSEKIVHEEVMPMVIEESEEFFAEPTQKEKQVLSQSENVEEIEFSNEHETEISEEVVEEFKNIPEPEVISEVEDVQPTVEQDEIISEEVEEETIQEDIDQETENDQDDHVDNFKPDFSELIEDEEMDNTTKRGRGRPRKEVTPTGEFIITNDKEFEEALGRAEKLMRKNEEPLSASQTKRIEKQIKELVDAMTKYKEGN